MHSVRLNSSGYTVNTNWDARLVIENGRYPGSWSIWDWNGGNTPGLTVAGERREKMVLLESSVIGKDLSERVLRNPTVICPQRGDVLACPVSGGMPLTEQFGRYVRINPDGSGKLSSMEIDTPRWHAVAVIIGDATKFPILSWPFVLNYFPVQVL